MFAEDVGEWEVEVGVSLFVGLSRFLGTECDSRVSDILRMMVFLGHGDVFRGVDLIGSETFEGETLIDLSELNVE